ncbi:Golgin subfamily A member 3 [Amphibalanus amphitrite]|uniref:Golgin subfamily A member 3 n=1 Tax=Amphibalanus amphitrite TaxID=1232801 RepID=A0A6A4VGB1_AMPAM|nr:Golgin subfamily A member 3 [Amphibalanus amphitrite]
MPGGGRSQPVSVHHAVVERPAPGSLQQPHLTEDTLMKMPVTAIGMDKGDQPETPHQHLGQQQQQMALMPANDAVSLLLPAGLSSIFCRSGPPSAPAVPQSPPAPQTLEGRSLQPYPRNLLQIVSDRRGAVPVPAPAPDRSPGRTDAAEMGPTSEPNGAPHSVKAANGDSHFGAAPASAPESATPKQTSRGQLEAIEECIVPALSSTPLMSTPPAPSSPPLSPAEEVLPPAVLQAQRAAETGCSPETLLSQHIAPASHNVHVKTVAHHPSNSDVPRDAVADSGARSDASTVTAESGAPDGGAVDEDDDRLSVVSAESSWSDISGFEEDLWRLRSVLRDPTAPVEAGGAAVASEEQQQLQLQVHRLQLQLQHASQERQLYRQQLEALQGQLSGGGQRQQLEVQRQKARLEGVLEMTRAELEERDALAAEAGLLRVRARELDAQLAEAAGKLETRAIELDAARDELKRSESAAAAERTALESARRELESRDATVSALKAKVAELVVDAQRQLQAKLRAEGSLKASQEARLQQQQQLLAAQQELIAQQHAGERLRGELTLARQAAAGAQARAVREKETLLRHLENIQADMLQREAFFQTVSGSRAEPAPAAAATAAVRERDEAVGRTRALELTIAELEQRLERGAEELSTAAAARKQLEEDGQKTRFALAAAHEKLSQQTVQCEQLQQRCLEGGQMLDQLRAQAKEAAAAKQTLKEEKTRLEVALASANQEKRDVDEAARGLTNELKKVSASFYKLKNDVATKDKQIAELKASLSGRESETPHC